MSNWNLASDLTRYMDWKKLHPTIGARNVDWDYILHFVPLETKTWAGLCVLEDADLFDEDYQVVVDTSGTYLRFKPLLYRDTILANLNLNSLIVKVFHGEIPMSHYNQLLRDIGYSLSGFRDARMTKDRLTNCGNF